MKGFVALALLLVAGLLVVGQFMAPVHPLNGPSALAAPVDRATSISGHFTPEGLVIDRDRSGQFHLETAVNGQKIRVLVDTGADTLALTVADAQAAGIDVNPNGFQPIVKTASGEGWGALVNVQRLEIGNTELHNVGAVVVKDLDVSLLGQSVLGRFGKLELQGDRMVLQAN